MKQGQAHNSKLSGIIEPPRAHAVSPAAVDQLGQATAFKKEQLYQGRGFEAPFHKDEIHHSGSQGKHK